LAEKTLEEYTVSYKKKLSEKEAVIEEQGIKQTYMSTEFENMLQVEFLTCLLSAHL
jgi:hypothetical protein